MIIPVIVKKNISVIIIMSVLTFSFVYDNPAVLAVDEKTDRQGERMRISIFPEGLERGEMMPEPESMGGSLFKKYCSQCHNMPNPVMLSGSEWPLAFERMVRHARAIGAAYEGIALPTEQEKREIIIYLQRNGLKALPEDDPSLKETEAIQFLWFCSTCHALPDPALHTSDEWKKVVEKMNENRTGSGRPPMSKKAIEKVLEFLSK
jgi:hypothetical protein